MHPNDEASSFENIGQKSSELLSRLAKNPISYEKTSPSLEDKFDGHVQHEYFESPRQETQANIRRALKQSSFDLQRRQSINIVSDKD